MVGGFIKQKINRRRTGMPCTAALFTSHRRSAKRRADQEKMCLRPCRKKTPYPDDPGGSQNHQDVRDRRATVPRSGEQSSENGTPGPAIPASVISEALIPQLSNASPETMPRCSCQTVGHGPPASVKGRVLPTPIAPTSDGRKREESSDKFSGPKRVSSCRKVTGDLM